MKNTEEQLDHQTKYYTAIVNELKNRIMSIEEKNEVTFATFSQIMR